MSILIKNIAEIYTGDELIKEGWIAIKGNKIAGLGKGTPELAEKEFSHVLDGRGKKIGRAHV